MSALRKTVRQFPHIPGLLFLLLLSGCGTDEVPDRPLGTPGAPVFRPSDGLLGNPGLQRLVDLQVERDGAGLEVFLSDPDPALRARAAYALGSVQNPEAGQALVPLLRDPDSKVRRDAAFALGQLSEARFGPVLLGALREEGDPAVRTGIFEALSRSVDPGAPESLRVLQGVLALDLIPEDEASMVLAVARMAVSGVTNPEGLEVLTAALSSQDESARLGAAWYFGRTQTPANWAAQAGAVRSVLDSLPPDDEVAAHLIRGLGRLGDPSDTPRVTWWLRSSPDWRIRANAAEAAAGRSADPMLRRALEAALEEPRAHVRVNAAGALSAVQEMPQGELDRLLAWLDDHPDDWRTAGPILALLGRMGQGRVLLDWLGRWEPDQVAPRTRGLGALAFVPGPEATQTLLDAASSDIPRIRGTALGGLARRWRIERQDPTKHEVYFQAFSQGLRTGDPSAVFVAAPALADSLFLPMGSVGVLEEEYRSLALPDDVEGMTAILGALGQTGAEGAEPLLREAAGHPVTAIRRAAAEALATVSGEEALAEVGQNEPDRRVDWEALAGLGPKPRMVLETTKGSVTMVLDSENAPLTVQTIAGFAQDGLFDDTPFHRVVPNFVVQGGDFARQDGFGGPGFAIRSEFTQTPYLRGVLGMASAGKDTEGSQFFITHSAQPHLDGGYTAFGWVVEGMDVVDHLYEEDRIISARIEPDSGTG